MKIAQMTEDQGVTWLAYFGAGLAGWGAIMIILAGALSNGILIISTLRKEKRLNKHGQMREPRRSPREDVSNVPGCEQSEFSTITAHERVYNQTEQ